MPVIYSNNASTTLSSGINNSVTTVPIASASGFPSITGSDYFFATIANTDNSKIEIVKVTAGTTSLTVVRGQDGTTAQAFDSGDNFQLRVTAATLEAATKTDVDIDTGSIATAALDDNAVTLAKMAGLARGKVIVGDASGDPSALALGSSGYVLKSDGTDIAWAADAGLSTEEVQDIAGGMFTGNTETGITVTYQDADGTVDLVIGAGDIAGSMIANDAIDSAHYAADSIDAEHYAAGSVDGTAIANDAVDSQHIAADSIDAEHYAAGSVDATALGADCVTAAKIGDDVINSEHYAADSIDAEHLNANSVNTDAIIDDAVTSAHLAAGAVDATAIGNDVVNSQHYAADSIDSEHYAAGSVDATAIGNDVVNSQHYAADSIDAEHYAAGSVDATALSASLGDLGAKGITDIGHNAGDKITFTDNTDMRFTVNAGEEMRLEADGDLHVDGDVIAYSTTISDATLKYNINPVEFALDKIKQLKGVTFNYFKDNKASAGLLAQDVEKVMPSAVSERKLPLHTGDDKSYKTLHYDSMTAILVEAIKELTAKVEKLENK